MLIGGQQAAVDGVRQLALQAAQCLFWQAVPQQGLDVEGGAELVIGLGVAL